MFYAQYPVKGGSGGSGVTIYPTFADFPGTAIIGTLSVAADTGFVYEYTVTGWQVIASPSGMPQIVELRTITAPEAAAKQLVLSGIPATANYTRLSVASAPSQFYGDDFVVAGNVLSWSGLGLDGLLVAGDKLTIEYN